MNEDKVNTLTLTIEDFFLSFWVPDNHRHSLPVGVKRQYVKDLVFSQTEPWNDIITMSVA